MPAENSVTHWIQALRGGDRDAAQLLWDRYFDRLVRVARQKLQGHPQRVADGEDAALDALGSVFRGVEEGRYPQLGDRDDLWRLLVLITAHKAWRFLRDESRQKRGGGRRPASAGDDEQAAIEQIIGREPSPAFAAQVAEECRLLLGRLGDPQLQSIAQEKMDGYSNDEIAVRLNCAPRTVERKLRLIRGIWEKSADLE